MDAGAQRVCFACLSARECAMGPARWTEYGAGRAQASAYSLRRSVTLSRCPPPSHPARLLRAPNHFADSRAERFIAVNLPR